MQRIVKALAFAAASMMLASCATITGVPLGAGDWVLAKWRPEDPYYYPAVVAERNGDQLSLRYDDGDAGVQPVSNVRRFDWRSGTHLECRFTNGQWYPAVITEMAPNRVDMNIRYEDGDTEATNSSKCRDR